MSNPKLSNRTIRLHLTSATILFFLCLCQLVLAQPYKNTDLPPAERSHALLKELTADEKISWLMNANPPIARLQLPGYDWWNEALHGVARHGKATVFPQAINLAATFDTSLVFQIAKSIGTEGRAKWNESRKISTNTTIYEGLTFWSPNINIFRDPRWGRGQETYGEDPWLTARIGVNFVKGIQYTEKGRPLAAACAKHFAVHSGPEKDRHSFNATPSLQDLNTTYLPAFRALVTEGKVKGVMCAYNRLFDSPCCASDTLLRKILKDQWNFKGYTVTDCGAIYDMHSFHKSYPTIEEAAVATLKAGVNLECGSAFQYLKNAYYTGKIYDSDLDSALFPLLQLKFELGALDPVGSHPFDTLSSYQVHHPDHQRLALQAAEKSIVLLHNNERFLPLERNLSSLAVLGPLAFEPFVLLGNYHGWSPNLSTVLEGITQAAPATTRISYEPAFTLYPSPTERSFDYESIKNTEVVVVTLGLNALLQGEAGDAFLSAAGGDLARLDIPENQLQFLKKLRVAYTGKIIVLLFSGSPLITSSITSLCDGILWCGYPGEQGGAAIGNVLFGKVSPSGKLPFSFPKNEKDIPQFSDYSMQNRTYRYSSIVPEYSFGFGLSYIDVGLDRLRPTTSDKQNRSFEVSIHNSNDRSGEDVLQVYLHSLKTNTDEARFTLVHFERITFSGKEQKKILVTLPKKAYSFTETTGAEVPKTGEYELLFTTKGPFDKASLRFPIHLDH